MIYHYPELPAVVRDRQLADKALFDHAWWSLSWQRHFESGDNVRLVSWIPRGGKTSEMLNMPIISVIGMQLRHAEQLLSGHLQHAPIAHMAFLQQDWTTLSQ
jgi:hypothetical protein